jgi:hypothetical protein
MEIFDLLLKTAAKTYKGVRGLVNTASGNIHVARDQVFEFDYELIRPTS